MQKLSFPIGTVLQCRDRLVRQAFRPMGSIAIRGQFLNELVDRVLQLLPDDVSRDAVFESLRYLSGQPLTEVSSVIAAWRIAGNVPRLRQGCPAPPWAAQIDREWSPLEIISGKPFRNQWKKVGTFFEFRAMAGTACPMKLKAFWSAELCRAMARRMGFSAPWHSYPYRSPMEFVRLRCVVLLDPELCRLEPRFRDLHEAPPASFITWNRKILKLRKRIKPCPRQFAHTCHKCAVGYEECPGGVHRLTYALRGCTDCGKEMYFDDDLSTEKCVNCQNKFLLRGA
jgi:hypothetical protein